MSAHRTAADFTRDELLDAENVLRLEARQAEREAKAAWPNQALQSEGMARADSLRRIADMIRDLSLP